MKTAYFNCSSGIAGDMILASLIDAGLSARQLGGKLKNALKIPGWRLSVSECERHHMPAKLLKVKGDVSFDSPRQMRNIITRAAFTGAAKKNMLSILDTLVLAESRVHNVPAGKVHFHELNSIDTLIDISGACLALEMLGIAQVQASPINVGRPAPATLKIITEKKTPVYSTIPDVELATPTGIAIITTLATSFGDMPCLHPEKAGFGAGEKILAGIPNLLSVIIGTTRPQPAGYDMDETVLLETNIDDMDPRLYPYVTEKLFSAAAKDVWLTQVLMKKGRPGIVLSVLCAAQQEKELIDIIFKETTTLGIRRSLHPRYTLKREKKDDEKIALLPNGKTRKKSEFEDARQKALKSSHPLRNILR